MAKAKKRDASSKVEQPTSKHAKRDEESKGPRGTKGRGNDKQGASEQTEERQDTKQARAKRGGGGRNKNDARETSDSDSDDEEIKINRSPVLTLWVSPSV